MHKHTVCHCNEFIRLFPPLFVLQLQYHLLLLHAGVISSFISAHTLHAVEMIEAPWLKIFTIVSFYCADGG